MYQQSMGHTIEDRLVLLPISKNTLVFFLCCVHVFSPIVQKREG